MSTVTAKGFTAHTGDAARYAPCLGQNHHDAAKIGTCDGCGLEVAKTETGRILNIVTRGDVTRKVACWSKGHDCDPERAAWYAAHRAELLASGELVKGQTVTVVKGRKVPVGTTGTIVWVGKDSWDKTRVGIRTADGEMVYTAASNVEVSA